MAHARTVALGRRLTVVQAERRNRLVDAARTLAAGGGYEAVTISAVCARAGVARASFYHYFGSKDHLLGEALLQWGRALIDELRRQPRAGQSALEQVVATLRWLMAAVVNDLTLVRAFLQALVSQDLGVNDTQRLLMSLMADYVVAGLGSSARIDVATLSMVLGHVFFSALVNMVADRLTAEQVLDNLTSTATLLLEPAATNRGHSAGRAKAQVVRKSRGGAG